VPCDGNAVGGEAVNGVPARISVRLEPDAAATNHSGIAIVATDPRAVRAVGLLPTGESLIAASGTLDPSCGTSTRRSTRPARTGSGSPASAPDP
jgi:hypothetical protein